MGRRNVDALGSLRLAPFSVIMGSLLALLIVALALLVIMPRVFMDYWWYQEIGYLPVFYTRIWARWALFGASSVGCFIVLYMAVSLSDRQSKKAPSIYAPSRAAAEIPGLGGLPFKVITVLVSLGFGFAISRNWLKLLTYLNRTPFDINDPVFGLDLSFHVFTYPFMTMVVGALMAVALLCILIALPQTIVTYARYPDIGVFERAVQLRIPAGVILILGGIRVYLARYGLLRAPNAASSIPVGAEYMDVTYKLPFYLVASGLLIATGVAIVYFTGRLRSQNWRGGAAGVKWVQATGALFGILLLVSLVIFPVIDSVSVAPNEPGIQRPYIGNHINFTLVGYSLSDVASSVYDPTGVNLSVEAALGSPTVINARILDYKPTRAVFQQKQEIRSYYQFVDPDVDRYTISGQKTEVMIGAREVVPAKLQAAARTWANEHLVYTHGLGVVLAPVNSVDGEGLPLMAVKDIPPSSNWLETRVEEPRIYFGELTDSYIVVNAAGLDEFDYPSGDENKQYRYEGTAGIQLKNGLRRLIAALHTGSTKMIFSNYISKESRLLIRRSIQERIRLVAPFLILDDDPFMFVENGRLYWMASGITHSDRYPYSEYSRLHGVRVNYVRDSVKIVVDAYTSEIRMYAIDAADPLIRTFRRIFPDIMMDGSEMPEEFKRHMRYPEDLFDVEMAVYSTYHMTDYKTFYNKEDVWEPATEEYQSAQIRVEPYNVLLASGKDDATEFALIQPFTPRNKQNMVAWVSAMQDPDEYGKIMVFTFPKGSLVPGPLQIEAFINQDEEISKSIALWNSGGSRVIRGNTLVLPVEGSIIYIKPLYLSAAQSEIPELKKVIAVFNNTVVMADTLQQAVAMAVSGGGAPTPPSGETLADLVLEYLGHLDKAEQYRSQGLFEEYGRELAAALEVRRRVEALLAKEGG